MKRYQKEIIKLTAKEALLRVLDLAMPFFESDRIYRVSARQYREHRDFEKSNFGDKIRYLRKQGLIDSFVENKENYIEITPKGIEQLDKIKFQNLSIPRPKRWDGKWRVVVFDIPNKNKVNRDLFRTKLVRLGFEKVQESIYVHPFECTEIVAQLSEIYSVVDYVLVMISEIIQGEDSIIGKFMTKNTITKEDLTNKYNFNNSNIDPGI